MRAVKRHHCYRFHRKVAGSKLALGSVALASLVASGCSVSNENVATAKKAGGDLKVPTFGEWISEAWRRYNTKPAVPGPVVPSPRVFDNRNATRPTSHPAWQLANALSADAPLQFGVSAANIFQIAATQSNPVRIGDVSSLRLAAFNAGNGSSNRSFAGNNSATEALARWRLSAFNSRTASAQNLPALQNQIERRERNAVETVLLQSLSAQNKARTNITRSLEAALQDDIALARRLDPDALEPYLPSDLQALALSNLRLDLLPALDKTAAEENISNEERVRRDIAIRAALREQELARRSALKRLREDLPVQLEATKREELQKTLEAQSQRDQQLRALAQANAFDLIAQDFTAADARLGIALPARPVTNLSTAFSNGENPTNNLKRTQNNGNTSFGIGEIKISNTSAAAVGVTRPRSDLKTNLENVIETNEKVRNRAPQIQVLKTVARNDARQWARISARRERAWQQNPVATSVTTQAKTNGKVKISLPQKSQSVTR